MDYLTGPLTKTRDGCKARVHDDILSSWSTGTADNRQQCFQ